MPTLGDMPLDKITPAMVRTWNTKTTKVGTTTAAQAYRLLYAMMATALADGDIARNPCQVRGAGHPFAPERPLVDRVQVEALAASMPEHLRAFVLLAFWAGLRLGEVLALQVGDLTLDAKNATGTVRIERQQQDIKRQTKVSAPKVGSVRTVHLPAPAVKALTDHLARQPAGLPTARVFTRPTGNLCAPSTCTATGGALARRTSCPTCTSTTCAMPG